MDRTRALLREGYTFTATRCDAWGTDLFTTRIGLRPVTFLRGAGAAEIFFDGERFTRAGAVPSTVQHLLQDVGSVQGLDGPAHRHRKQAFLSLMDPASMDRLGRIFDEEWSAQWERARSGTPDGGPVVLRGLARRVLAATACRWAGIPLTATDLPRLGRELGLMIDRVAAFGPTNWYARWRRRGTEEWAADLIGRVRSGMLSPAPGSALHVFAHHGDEEGAPLPTQVAAVELINVLRPLMAVARFIVFAAVALERHPRWYRDFAGGEERDLEPFVHEVRRYFPFFPAVPGRVRRPFEWRGHRFATGDRAVLNLYGTCHDRRLWQDPHSFDPQRFRGFRWEDHPYALVAQGAGWHAQTHRCPGEWSTVEVLKRAVRQLAAADYRVPVQDLTIPLDRIPALPRSGILLTVN